MRFRIFLLLLSVMVCCGRQALAQAAPAAMPTAEQMEAMKRLPELFGVWTGHELKASAKDATVPANAVGFLVYWRGRPWYEPLIFCAALTAYKADDSRVAVGEQIFGDALSRYEADHGKSRVEAGEEHEQEYFVMRHPFTLLSAQLDFGKVKSDLKGFVPDPRLCGSMHRQYAALAH